MGAAADPVCRIVLNHGVRSLIWSDGVCVQVIEMGFVEMDMLYLKWTCCVHTVVEQKACKVTAIHSNSQWHLTFGWRTCRRVQSVERKVQRVSGTAGVWVANLP